MGEKEEKFLAQAKRMRWSEFDFSTNSEATPLVPTSHGDKEANKWRLWREKYHGWLFKHGQYTAGRRNTLMGTAMRGGMAPGELQKIVEAFAREDKDEEKTWARLLVEKFLQKVEKGW